MTKPVPLRTPEAYTKKDFMSDQTIRWCPGCGDYSILSQAQTVLGEIGLPREQIAVVSGIGCSSRFPYYINSFGFHTIHGRAPAVATGLKITRPELSVWIATGDGDALSIGGNHLIHLLRRNVDLQLLLFNNRIYGLTKGQYSPTSEEGKKTKSTPVGSVDHPFEPCLVALGADGTFVARTVDVFVKEQRDVMLKAHEHGGTSFVEIWQNCNIFNDGAFDSYTDKKARDEKVVFVEHGKPLVYGAEGQKKGLRLNGLALESFDLVDGDTSGCLVYDETNRILAQLVAGMRDPVAMGVMYRIQRPRYEDGVQAQIAQAKAKGAADLQALMLGSNTWTVT